VSPGDGHFPNQGRHRAARGRAFPALDQLETFQHRHGAVSEPRQKRTGEAGPSPKCGETRWSRLHDDPSRAGRGKPEVAGPGRAELGTNG